MRYLLAAAIVAMMAVPGMAAGIYSTGFEGPTFSPGVLSGQDSWNGDPTVVVQTTVVAGGSQALQVSADGSYDGNLYAVADRGFANPVATNPIVTVSQSVRLSDLMEADFGMAYVGDGIASFVDFSFDGSVLLNGAAVGLWTPDTWFDTTVVMDFDTQTAQISLGGGPLSAPIAFQEASTNLYEIWLLTDNYIDTNTSSMYYDNLDITATPEPATLSLLGLGLSSLLLRRRRRTA